MNDGDAMNTEDSPDNVVAVELVAVQPVDPRPQVDRAGNERLKQ